MHYYWPAFHKLSETLTGLLSWGDIPNREPLTDEWLKAQNGEVRARVVSAHACVEPFSVLYDKLNEARSLAHQFSRVLFDNPDLASTRFHKWTSPCDRELFEEVRRLAKEFELIARKRDLGIQAVAVNPDLLPEGIVSESTDQAVRVSDEDTDGAVQRFIEIDPAELQWEIFDFIDAVEEYRRKPFQDRFDSARDKWKRLRTRLNEFKHGTLDIGKEWTAYREPICDWLATFQDEFDPKLAGFWSAQEDVDPRGDRLRELLEAYKDHGVTGFLRQARTGEHTSHGLEKAVAEPGRLSEAAVVAVDAIYQSLFDFYNNEKPTRIPKSWIEESESESTDREDPDWKKLKDHKVVTYSRKRQKNDKGEWEGFDKPDEECIEYHDPRPWQDTLGVFASLRPTLEAFRERKIISGTGKAFSQLWNSDEQRFQFFGRSDFQTYHNVLSYVIENFLNGFSSEEPVESLRFVFGLGSEWTQFFVTPSELGDSDDPSTWLEEFSKRLRLECDFLKFSTIGIGQRAVGQDATCKGWERTSEVPALAALETVPSADEPDAGGDDNETPDGNGHVVEQSFEVSPEFVTISGFDEKVTIQQTEGVERLIAIVTAPKRRVSVWDLVAINGSLAEDAMEKEMLDQSEDGLSERQSLDERVEEPILGSDAPGDVKQAVKDLIEEKKLAQDRGDERRIQELKRQIDAAIGPFEQKLGKAAKAVQNTLDRTYARLRKDNAGNKLAKHFDLSIGRGRGETDYVYAPDESAGKICWILK